MIELRGDRLSFSFPSVHAEAGVAIEFQRTLRIPDDDATYPLPPGLGRFPLRHVDDFAASVPKPWLEHGGVLLPMYQSEAMWINFEGPYPCAVKVAAGKIDAVTGDSWTRQLKRDPQNYVVTPRQPWLDGFCVGKGVIRQFVAMPLGAGYSAEEQITGEAEYGGLQIAVCPMKAKAYNRLTKNKRWSFGTDSDWDMAICACAAPDMGLAPGGRMKQEIYEDSYALDEWDVEAQSRCFVHLANSMVWREITGENPPTTPPTAREYTQAGLPWFEYYDETATPLPGSSKLAGLRSVTEMAERKGDAPLPENQPVRPTNVVREM